MSELIKCVVLSPLLYKGLMLLPTGEGEEPVTVELTQQQIDILRPMGVVKKLPKARKSSKTAVGTGDTVKESAK